MPSKLLFLAALGLVAGQAQPIQLLGMAGPPRKPVIADVLTQKTLQTPFGEKVLSYWAKFSRASNGSGREDQTEFGFSIIYDARQARWIFLDHQLRTAVVEMAAPFDQVARYSWRTFRSFAAPGIVIANPTGRLRERPVVGQTIKGTSMDGGRLDLAVWEYMEFGVLAEKKVSMPFVEDVVQLQNLREEEPDPVLFTLPEGYKVTTCWDPDANRKPKDIPYCVDFKDAP